MKTSSGETIANEEYIQKATIANEEYIQKARDYAASVNIEYADNIRDGKVKFSTMSPERIKEFEKKQRKLAEEIKAGKHDSNFTIWQRMNYFFTGKSEPLFKK